MKERHLFEVPDETDLGVFILIRRGDGGHHVDVGPLKGRLNVPSAITLFCIGLAMEYKRMVVENAVPPKIRNSMVRILDSFMDPAGLHEALSDLIEVAAISYPTKEQE